MTETLKKQMSGIDEVKTLLNSRRKAILINTFEENRLQEDLKFIFESKMFNVYTWSITDGLRDLVTNEIIEKIHDPIILSRYIQKTETTTAFILKDFHDIWTNYQAKRAIRDVLEQNSNIYTPIIFISPETNIPKELEKLITVVQYELPTREQVIEDLEGMIEYLKQKDLPVPEGRLKEAIIHALVGMTKSEIINVLKKSVARHKQIVLDEIVAEKAQVIKKTGLLEYVTKLGNIEDVGGMDIFKDWLEDAKYAFEPEARKYNIDPVRGAITVGVPGSGKSLMAKSLAHLWNLPLLKMNMSD